MIDRALARLAAAWVTAIALAGCGGGGSNLDCSEFVACGGDLEGTWTIEGACPGEPFDLEDCPQGRLSLTVSVSGTMTFGADGSFEESRTTTSRFNLSVPGSCLPPEITSCEQLEDGGDGVDAVCTGNAQTSCSCNASDTEQTAGTGTYQVNGTTVQTSAGDSFDFFDFCVAADVETGTDTLRLESGGQILVLSRQS